MDKIKNLSLKKSFLIYLGIGIISAMVLSFLMNKIAIVQLSNLTDRYFHTSINGNVEVMIPSDISIHQKALLSTISIISTFGVPMIFSGCIIASIALLYHNKIKAPLDLLSQAASRIAQSDLDFQVEYESKDAFGELCKSFEYMRGSLERNHKEMWRMLEERKRLNAAFSHDLRTPITVAKGNCDMIQKYYPQDKISKEQMLQMVGTIKHHLERLELQTDSMSTARRLGDLPFTPSTISLSFLYYQMRETIRILVNQSEKKILWDFEGATGIDEVEADTVFLLEVMDNLMTNALRFARSRIHISCSIMSHIFLIEVSDDGRGFSKEELQEGTKPFNSSNKEEHDGMGLHICEILCEKHGGQLVISNKEEGGAVVRASFLIEYAL